MQRIDVTTAAASLPTPAALGTPGYFTGGNPGTGTPATILDADFFNGLQEELMAIIADGGLSASKTTLTQVRDAIRVMISGATKWPSFGATLSGGKTLTNNTATKIAFDVEEFDNNSNYDPTTNYRFQPTVAGTYAITLTANLGAGAAPGIFWVAVYKNGGVGRAGPSIPMPGTQAIGSSLSTLVILNGTTDYVEFYAFQTSGSSQTIQQSGTHVQAIRVA